MSPLTWYCTSWKQKDAIYVAFRSRRMLSLDFWEPEGWYLCVPLKTRSAHSLYKECIHIIVHYVNVLYDVSMTFTRHSHCFVRQTFTFCSVCWFNLLVVPFVHMMSDGWLPCILPWWIAIKPHSVIWMLYGSDVHMRERGSCMKQWLSNCFTLQHFCIHSWFVYMYTVNSA